MNCSREWIESYLDEELDSGAKAAAEEHLATCRDCSETYQRLREQKSSIKAEAPYYAASPRLEHRVREALHKETVREEKGRSGSLPWRAVAIAASLLLAISVAWNLSQIRNRAGDRDLMAKEVLSGHIRSLIGTHLLDVPSTDQHTVKPWFNGKLDFSPPVNDLAAQGFPLAGGRVDYLNGRPVAALVYHRRLHVINLFVWPSGSQVPENNRYSQNGFHLIHWTDGSMAYWAVSDISMAELEHFRELLK